MARGIETLTSEDFTLYDRLALANAKRQAMREAGVVIERLDPLERARRNPRSLRLAVTGKCWNCFGAGADGIAFTKETIRDCKARDCPLWEVRPYKEQRISLNKAFYLTKCGAAECSLGDDLQ